MDGILKKIHPSAVIFHLFENFPLIERISREYPCYLFLHAPNFCPAGTKHYTFPRDSVCQRNGGMMCAFLPYLLGCSGVSRRSLQPFEKYKVFKKWKESLQFFRKIFVTSEFMKEEVERVTSLSPQLLPLFPFHYHFTPIPRERIPIILFAGRLDKVKGCSVLLDAISYLKNKIRFQVIIAGDGYWKDVLLKKLQR